ncbi:uncharacterized protein CTHT_0066930 [Thermochaetoides thermophila DSM 1495]|uniref:Uncharacterized protein n=1 Tax=Chaetomium thermophilum (strain DSM 1495 / CBS 144.50 / IMI 039719) TaxID=759272 RepID=G0SGN1_CHATD|nr:hypothetical protein CTHT_0066930 [Thermochaetoides thermophila DSM 1495]EGS17370.1 hypothetical protein CTHT_0066930 [Thermochaetoides thermophila DSM 1495]
MSRRVALSVPSPSSSSPTECPTAPRTLGDDTDGTSPNPLYTAPLSRHLSSRLQPCGRSPYDHQPEPEPLVCVVVESTLLPRLLATLPDEASLLPTEEEGRYPGMRLDVGVRLWSESLRPLRTPETTPFPVLLATDTIGTPPDPTTKLAADPGLEGGCTPVYGVVDPLPSLLLDELGLEEEVNWVSLALGPGTGIPGEVSWKGKLAVARTGAVEGCVTVLGEADD